MVERDRESTPDLRAIEEAWDSPKPAKVQLDTERKIALDAAADRLIESLPPLAPDDLDALDSGWGDDEDEEEEEEEEPELPDERLDPVAYAAAKKARDERVEARKQRRRIKADAKKARRKARADAARGKQKAKTKKPLSPEAKAKAKAEAKAKVRAKAKAGAKAGTSAVENDAEASAAQDSDDDAVSDAVPSRARATKTNPSKPMLSKTNTWMLAVAVLVFVAAAIFAAVVAR